MSSVHQQFKNTCALFPDNAFLHIPAVAASAYSDGACDLTYADAGEQVATCATNYREQGYGAPMRIALVLENRPDFFIHWLALNSLGCSVLPISSDVQTEEIAYFLEHGEAALVVAVPEAIPRLQEACALLENAPAITNCQQPDTLPPAPESTADLVIDGDTECALLYTSGSTGKPKGCMLSNDYFITSGEWYTGLGGLTRIHRGEERLLTPLPLGHMNAMACSTMAMIMSAGCIVQLSTLR